MLPRCFKPQVTTPLVRIGSKNDGGYVIPERVLATTEVLYGFGIHSNWEFEEEFRRRSSAKVECFDHTMGIGFWGVETTRDVLALCTLGYYRPSRIRGVSAPRRSSGGLLLYWDYKRFFDGTKAKHHHIMIAPEGYGRAALNPQATSGTTDLDNLFAQHQSDRCFLKIDIEGWEYRILDQLFRHQNRMTGLVVEFHDVDLHRERIVDFIGRLELKLLHIHNSGLDYDSQGDPLLLEMTFASVSPDDCPQEESSYPIAGLDAPTLPGIPEYKLAFE